MLQRTQMLQRTVFINKIRMLQRTQILQRTNNTIQSYQKKPGCYNERGGILFIMETSIIVFTTGRPFMLFKFTCTVYKS